MAETTVETNALTTREQMTGELGQTLSAAQAQHEIQGAIIVARRFPRSEDAAYQKLLRACERPTFAEDAAYSFPRGGTVVTGASIYLAREFARSWGNIRHGFYVVHDDDEMRTIRAWAWDLETNARVESEDSFRKIIFRKKASKEQEIVIKVEGKGFWVRPDERDLRELTNRRAAIAKRNCLLEILPSDMVDEALAKASETLANKAAKDPDATRKTIVRSFGELNVPVGELEAYLKHPIAQCSPAELATLRQVYKSIRDGNTTCREHFTPAGSEVDVDSNQARAQQVKDRLRSGKGGEAKKPAADEPAPQSAAIPSQATQSEAERPGAESGGYRQREIGDEPPDED